MGNICGHSIEKTSRPKSSSYLKYVENPIVHDFRVLRPLGQGGFGKVFLVEQRSTKHTYALKCIEKLMLKQKHCQNKAVMERNILRDVESPFIVNLHYSFQTASKLCLVMDYMEGGNLFSLLQKQRKLSEDQARYFAAQIVLGLEALHDHDIVHRDIKPENILLDEHGHIKIADFNVSDKASDNSNSYSGTIEYIPPEVINHDIHNKQVDYWGLGVVLYEMLVGLPPFVALNKKVLVEKILKEEPSFGSNVSEDAKDLILRLLKKDPKERPSQISEIKTHKFFSGLEWDHLLDISWDVPTKSKDLVKTAYISEISNDEDEVDDPEFDYEDFDYCRTQEVLKGL